MLNEFIIGLLVALFAAMILYAFRVRQLYLTLPRLFSESSLTRSGKMAEIRIINRGRISEEDIVISLAPGRQYEVVASTDSSLILEHNTLEIPRIPPNDDFSVLLMIEGGDFSKNEISTISSKTTKGKIFDGLEQVPPNYGNLMLAIAFFVFIAVTPIIGIDYYNDWQKAKSEKQRLQQLAELNFLKDKGWTSLEWYSNSTYRQNYNKGEFPIFQKSVERKGDIILITFGVINKAAAELSLMDFPEWPFKGDDPKPWEHINTLFYEIEPGGTIQFVVKMYWPKGKKGNAKIQFNMSVGADSNIMVEKNINVNL